MQPQRQSQSCWSAPALLSMAVIASIALSGRAARAASEVVVSIRYLLPKGATSHAHLYLFRQDGRLLRQLTHDDGGQEVEPVFAPDGETIVFARDIPDRPREFWSIRPRGGDLKRLKSAPNWYVATHSSPYFTNSPYALRM